MEPEIKVWEGNPEWTAYLLGFVVDGLLLLGSLTMAFLYPAWGIYLLIIPVIMFGAIYIARHTNHFTVTNQRIICRSGILSKRSVEIDIRDIRTINVTQSMGQRLLRIGDLEFSTASGPVKEAILINIKNPDLLKEKIRSYKIEKAAN
jgi:uncharacterized membrane protein YdbT with pleckstrin-like domain